MRLPEVGTLFQSRYRLDAILGAGGFATVYQATDTMADRTVALKVLKPELTGYPPDVRSRFDQEVQMVANLRDQHTLTLFDFGTSTEGLLYMVTEYVPGEDVPELMKRRGRLEPHEVIHILMQVLQSLREAHANGLLHRDIKPANIRVFEYAGDPLCVRVLDFGIAKRMGKDAAGITKDGAIIGTPRYMSPEQLLQDELTPASDIYSLGVVAFELLMGSERIHGTQLADQLSRLATGHVFSIPELERIGPELCRILDRMTTRDQASRFRTADEVYGALSALRRGPGQRGSSDMIPVSNHHTPQGFAPPRFGPNRAPSSLRPPPGVVPQTGSHERPMRPPPSTGTMTVEQPRTSPAMMLAGAAIVVVLVVGALGGIYVASSGSQPKEQPTSAVTKPRPSLVRPPTTTEPDPEPDEEEPRPTIVARKPSPGCGMAAPFRGLGKLKITSGLEILRMTVSFIPSGYEPKKAHPLFVMMHENAETPTEFITYSELAGQAEEHGAVLIAPAGGFPYAWKGNQWTNTIKQAIDDAMNELCIDPDRIYLVGHSAGGRQSEATSCELSIARGIATTSFRGPPHRKHPCDGDAPGPRALKDPIPYLHIAPLQDGYNPLDGGKGCSGSKKLSLKKKEEEWKTRNSCSGKRRIWRRAPDGVCYTWDCEAAFVSCHVEAGRNWDGFVGKRLWDHNDCDGPPTDFPYAETIWSFFEEFASE